MHMQYKRSFLPSIAIAEVPFGLAAGAALGSYAGPPGLVAGALLGGVVGALLSIAQNRQMHRESEEVDRFDETVGITSGDLGVPNLEHPPATIGTYSSSSLGLGWEADPIVSRGPINAPS
jgi:hypothetical protein